MRMRSEIRGVTAKALVNRPAFKSFGGKESPWIWIGITGAAVVAMSAFSAVFIIVKKKKLGR